MGEWAAMLEERIPDVVSTADLPVPLAAEIDFLAGRVDRWCEQSSEVSAAISARSLALSGRPSEARQALERFDPTDASVVDLAAAAWAASRVGGESIAQLRAHVEMIDEDFLEDDVPVGPRELFVGMLRAASGDLGGAVEALESAVEVGDRRAPLWGALCRIELGRAVRSAEAVSLTGTRTSGSALTAARAFFAAGGYAFLLGRVASIAGPVDATLIVGTPSVIGLGAEPLAEVRPSKGLIAIRHLVQHSHRTVSAVEVAAVLDGGDGRERAALTRGEWMSDIEAFDGGASTSTDALRATFFDDATRSRVTKLIRRTIAKIGDAHASIAAHLEASVSTGHACRYVPAGAPVRWTFEAAH